MVLSGCVCVQVSAAEVRAEVGAIRAESSAAAAGMEAASLATNSFAVKLRSHVTVSATGADSVLIVQPQHWLCTCCAVCLRTALSGVHEQSACVAAKVSDMCTVMEGMTSVYGLSSCLNFDTHSHLQQATWCHRMHLMIIQFSAVRLQQHVPRLL